VVVATGHLNRERPLEIGDWVEIGGQFATVRTIEPLLGERELRLVVQLSLDRDESAEFPSQTGRLPLGVDPSIPGTACDPGATWESPRRLNWNRVKK
jgi:hypothetical protein